ncbi:hypothetical protein EDD86DRAFT_208784 [Gorgonomyces haynaldii]|nr:hypothetical protein EDD86DRAFT_208784 [Gorgonomyces haynaldii]
MLVESREFLSSRMPNKNPTKVVYHPKKELAHTPGEQDFFVYVEPGMVEKWRKDRSIALVDVVQAFTIFEVPTGKQHGIEEKASKSTLWNAFDSEDETKIIEIILEHGKIVEGSKPNASSKGYVVKN